MGLFQRILNLAPAPGAALVLDNRQLKYWLTWEQDEARVLLLLSRREKLVGKVELWWDPPDLQLCDINILKPEHRNRGLGTFLLHEAISFARQIGAESIFGPVSKRDLEATPNLLRWYRHNGFQVALKEDNVWAADIYLDKSQCSEERNSMTPEIPLLGETD